MAVNEGCQPVQKTLHDKQGFYMKPTEIDWMYEGHPWKGVVEPSVLNELSRARVLMHIPTDTELSMCLVVHLCSRFPKKTKEDPSAD